MTIQKPLAFRLFRAGLKAALMVLVVLLVPSAQARFVRDHRDASIQGGAYTLNVTPVVDFLLNVPAGRKVTCATSNTSAGADPMLDVFTSSTQSTTPQELARDDDSAGNLNARVTFTAPADGRVRIVMRASGASTGGTANLKCSGYRTVPNLPFGGAFKRVEGYRPNETLLTVPLPGGPRGYKVYLLDPDSGQILRRYVSGANESVLVLNPPSNFIVMVGAYPGDFAVIAGSDGPVAPPVGGVFDPGRHATGSVGVGEVADRADTVLGAEPTSRAADPPGNIRLVRNDVYLSGHDPDQDGLGTELEAQIGTCSNKTEIAGGNWDCSRSFDPTDTDGDGLTDKAELLGLFAQAPYQLLPRWGADPRHKDIFVEVDFWQQTDGEAPRKFPRDTALKMATIYADPETNEIFKLAHAQSLNNPDLKPGISLHLDTGMDPPPGAPLSEFTTYGDWGGYSFHHPICPVDQALSSCWKVVIPTAMNAIRTGIFHYAFGYPGGGGQAAYHSIGLNIPIDVPGDAAHEFGHTLGLTHGGPDGIGPDANCKPNYPSVMSYAYNNHDGFVPSFSDGYGRAALNNAALTERAHVAQPTSGPGKAYLLHLRNIFRYNVDLATGDVDWNRDGVISDGTVKAYANNDHSSCEFTRVNQMNAAGLANSAVTLTRLGTATILLYVDESDRRLHLEYTTDSLACPANTENCGPPLKASPLDASWNTAIDAVDAHPIGTGMQKKLLVVFRKGNALYQTTMASGFVWSAPVAIPLTGGAMNELSLGGDATQSFLAYKNAASQAILKRRDASGNWGADEPVTDNGGSVFTLGPKASPGILLWKGRMFGAFPVGEYGALRIYERDATNGRWSTVPWNMNGTPSTIGRPALAMERVGSGSPLPGRMRLMYIARGSDGQTIIHMMTLEALGLGASATLTLTDEIHDNVWYFGNGVDLLYEEGVDTNLRAAVASALITNPPTPHYINFRPKADGAVFQVYRNWNDWEALGIDTCRDLMKAGAGVTCAPWPYTEQSQPAPPSTPPPEITPQQCIAVCRSVFQSCQASGGPGNCVRQQTQCIAQCRR